VFNDNRSKKLIVVAHCLVNQNSISDGTADFPSQFQEVIELLMENKLGIIQLPCPELSCLGLDRGDKAGAMRDLLSENTRIRNLLEEPQNIARLRAKADDVIEQIEEYQRHGFEVLGLIGINRSPSCGIETTTKSGREEPGKGVFITVLKERLHHKGIALEMIGIKTSQVVESIACVKKLIQISV
jgi:predicted secreted protein